MANIPQWKVGDVLSASKLNAMVNAINDLLAAQTGNSNAYITLAELNDILKQYSDVGHTHSVNEIVDLVLPTKLSQLQNDTSYATEDYVTNAIADAQLGGDGEVDLSAYATKNYVDNEIDNIFESLDEYIEPVYGNNYITDTNGVTSFVNNQGETVNGKFTNYIPLKKGVSYISNLSYTQYHFFDIDKNHLSTSTFMTNPQIFAASNDGYLLIKLHQEENPIVLEGTDIGAYKGYNHKIQRDKIQPISKWYGKKWLCIGDSISTDIKQYADVGYAKLISRELGMTLTNVAVSGKNMSYYYDLIDGYPENYDLITVMLGANNHGYNCAMGELNDELYKNGTYDSNDSFYAQTQLLYEKLRAKYPKSVIMFIGLIKRWAPNESSNNEDGYMINAQGNTTQAYCEALEKMCAWYSIPYVDVYNTIDPRSLLNRQTFFCGETDGTHPNDIGHALFIAPVIRNAIIKHEPYYFNDWSNGIQYGKIQIDTSTLSLNEGASGTINVTLDKAPTHDQTVNITSDNADVTISPSSLTFTSDNFGTPQVITITVAEDDDEYADETANVILSTTSGASNVTVSVSITDNDEEPTTDPDEPTTDPDEPQTANLIHKWLGVDTAVVDERYGGYSTLHDQVGELDLTSSKFWMGDANNDGHYVTEEYKVNQKIGADLWDMPDVMSFSIKINKYTRVAKYFSLLTMVHTGSIGGLHFVTDNWSGYNGTNGRFKLHVVSTASATFGSGVVAITYRTSAGDITLKGDSTIKMMNDNDTADILLTFDSETNTVEVYQDGTKILSSILDIPLRIDGITNGMDNINNATYESIEIYDGVIGIE